MLEFSGGKVLEEHFDGILIEIIKRGFNFPSSINNVSKTWDSSVEFITQSLSQSQNMHGFNISGGHVSSKLSYGIKIAASLVHSLSDIWEGG